MIHLLLLAILSVATAYQAYAHVPFELMAVNIVLLVAMLGLTVRVLARSE